MTRSPGRRPRGAVTLIEFLVIVAVIAIVVALLVPAILKVREVSARAQCANNLRQIGLAFHGHHDVYQMLPSGGRDTPPSTLATTKRDYSWCYQILPFIGQHGLYSTTDPAKLDTTPVPLYYCPARRSVRLYHHHAVSDYAGNGGTDLIDGLDGTIVRTGAGVVNIGRMPSTSNVLLLGERRVNLAYIEECVDNQDSETCYRYGWNGNGIRWARPVGNSWLTPAPDLGNPAIPANATHYQFGSSHPAGMNVCFADGSVRTISFTVSPAVFRNVCVRNERRDFEADCYRPRR